MVFSAALCFFALYHTYGDGQNSCQKNLNWGAFTFHVLHKGEEGKCLYKYIQFPNMNMIPLVINTIEMGSL